VLEREVELSTAGIRLAGTACVPSGAGRFPTVLMIHGSGPLDRDENMPGQRLDVFNTIARHLAAAGIASVRYDKRGCGKSTGDYCNTGCGELVHDAGAFFDALPGYDFCDPSRRYLLAHSEGCVFAPLLAIERPAVAGLLLLCPFIDNAELSLLQQARQIEQDLAGVRGVWGAAQRFLFGLGGGPIERQRRLIQRIKASDSATIRLGLQRFPAKWLRELMAIEPREIFSRVACPMLLIGGEKDVQCDPGAGERIAEVARGEVERHVIANLTHILRSDPGPPSLFGAHKRIGDPLDPAVLSLIADWLKARQLQIAG
jgi:pimeloyl-ACP methyl ester carboxylesterase